MNVATQVPPSLSPSHPLSSPIKPQAPSQLPSIASPIQTSSSKFVALVKAEAPPDSSPDPLGIMANSSPVPVTPRKRKSAVEVQSPLVKRMQITRSELDQTLQYKSSSSLVPATASSKSISAGSLGSTPTPKRLENLAYVAVPRSPWLTDSAGKNGFLTPTNSPLKQQKLMMQGTPDDLGGYGESDLESPIKHRGLTDSIKSSARRTGERDDRGRLTFVLKLVLLTPSFSTS